MIQYDRAFVRPGNLNLNMSNFDYQEKELKRELARREHLEFIKYCWVKNKKTSPFIVGQHTKPICEYIDHAFSEYRRGKSTFGIVQMPPQHGKSDIISRYLPPRFLGEFPEKELVIASHTAKQAYKFSRFGRNLVKNSAQFKELYDIELACDSQSVENWELSNGIGKAQWFGIQSGIAGNGGDCVILDDYFRTREDADSPVIREKVWSEFTDGMMTRRHDPSIFIMLATQWDVDDLIGRYKDLMERNPCFPKAEILSFPAEHEDYPEQYLFPELYSKQFYEEQKEILQVNGIQIMDIDNNKVYPYASN